MSNISAAGNHDRTRVDVASHGTSGAPRAASPATARTAQEVADAAAQHEMQDGVHLAEQGQEAATHIGATQDLASQARRLGNTRNALSAGAVHVGDAEPGVAEEQASTPPATPSPTQGNVPTAMPILMDDPGAPAPGMPTGATGSRTDWANRAKAAQDDAEQANTIFQQMAAERQKTMMQIWKIWQDAQTAMFQIMQEVILHRQQVHDKIMAEWDAVLRG